MLYLSCRLVFPGLRSVFKKCKAVLKNRVVLHESFFWRVVSASSTGCTFPKSKPQVALGAQLPHPLSFSQGSPPHLVAPQHLGRVSVAICHYIPVDGFIKENCFHIPLSLGKVGKWKMVWRPHAFKKYIQYTCLLRVPAWPSFWISDA